MSSCAVFFFTCCRGASCASATSASSPIAGALLFCRSAFALAPALRHRSATGRFAARRQPHARGTVPDVAGPCRSSNDSPALNSCSDPHLVAAGAQHEPISPIANHPRAPAPIRPLCLICARNASFLFSSAPHRNSLTSLLFAIARCLSIAPPQPQSRSSLPPAQANTNPIAPAALLASFKSLYLQRPHTASANNKFFLWALQIQP